MSGKGALDLCFDIRLEAMISRTCLAHMGYGQQASTRVC
jgi:hypothetical protein